MTCRACAQPICSHTDLEYAGVVTFDTSSPSGSYDRALRHRALIDAARRPHARSNAR